MSTTVKNAIMFLVIGVLVVLAYIFFIQSKDEGANLTTTPSSEYDPSIPPVNGNEEMNAVTEDFLSVLLSVQNIKLDDAIFSDKVFAGLYDSSILLVPTGDEGRPNPFAPIVTPAPPKTGGASAKP